MEVHRIVENTPSDPQTEEAGEARRKERVPYDRNKAMLPKGETQNARNLSDKKEVVSTMKLLAFDARERRKWTADGTRNHPSYSYGPNGFRTVVDARFYMGRSGSASTVYCAVWIHARDGRGFSGRGSAGGCGFHKTSAALEGALSSAGVTMEGSFGGCGEEAMRVALRAIGRAAGYGRLPTTVVES